MTAATSSAVPMRPRGTSGRSAGRERGRVEGRVDGTGRDHVHAHAIRTADDRERSGDPLEARLGGGVRRGPGGVLGGAHDAAHEDHRAARRHERRPGEARRRVGRAEVHGQHVVPAVRVVPGSRGRDARGAHQGVETTAVRRRRRDGASHDLAGPGHPRSRPACPAVPRRVGRDRHRPAVGDQPLGDGTADARRGARDEGAARRAGSASDMPSMVPAGPRPAGLLPRTCEAHGCGPVPNG